MSNLNKDKYKYRKRKIESNLRLESYANYINTIWKRYINGRHQPYKYHLFLSDMKRTDELERKMQKSKTKINRNYQVISVDLDEYFLISDCHYIPKKILPKKLVDDVFNSLMSRLEPPSWTEIEKKIATFSNYLL